MFAEKWGNVWRNGFYFVILRQNYIKYEGMNTINTIDKRLHSADFSYSTQYVSEAKPLSKFGEWFFSNKGDFNLQINDMKAILK